MVPNLCVPHSSTTLEVHHPPPRRKLAPSVLCSPAPLSNRLDTSWSGHRRPPAGHHLSPGGQPSLTAVVPFPVLECQVQVQVGAPSPPARWVFRRALLTFHHYFTKLFTVHSLSHLLHHLVPASAHSAAGVLPVLLLPDQGEVQVHVLCHLQHQGQAGMLKTTLC